jgi:hypothetical protein
MSPAVLDRRVVRPAALALMVLAYLAPWLELDGTLYRGFDFEAFMAAYRAHGGAAADVPPITWHLVRLAPYAAGLVAVLEWRRLAERAADLLYYVVLLVPPFALVMALLEGGGAHLAAGAAAPFAAAVAGLAAGRFGRTPRPGAE